MTVQRWGLGRVSDRFDTAGSFAAGGTLKHPSPITRSKVESRCSLRLPDGGGGGKLGFIIGRFSGAMGDGSEADEPA